MSHAGARRVLVALGLLAGCGSSVDTSLATDALIASTLTPDEVAASMVEVVARGCGPAPAQASAVKVADDLVVTVAHAVAGASEVTTRISEDGPETAARVVAFDDVADLALLEVLNIESGPVPIGSLEPGDRATLIGFGGEGGPHQRPVEVTRKVRATIENFTHSAEVVRPSLEFIGDVTLGDSGGPLLDANGAIGAIVFAESDERAALGFAVRASELKRVLDNTGTSSPTRPDADVGPCPS